MMDFRDSRDSDMTTDMLEKMAAETSAPAPTPADTKSVRPQPYPVEVDHARDARLTDFGKETLNDLRCRLNSCKRVSKKNGVSSQSLLSLTYDSSHLPQQPRHGCLT